MARRLLFVIAVVAGGAWLAAPALSLEPPRPHAADFAQRVPGQAAAGARTTAEVRAPGRFDLVGFSWDGGGRPRIKLRVRRDGERWGRWVPVGTSDSAPGRSDPVWVGGADAYQLRLSRRPAGLRAHFVTTAQDRDGAGRLRALVAGAFRTAAVALTGSARADGDGDAPGVVPRKAWDGGQCTPRRAPVHGEVQVAFVHHTVSATDYAPEDSAAMVLAICRYHRDTNGWDDIGYNFLVDRYGRVFEGRAGGIDQPVVGAHTQGFNRSSTGIAHLGTFSDRPQTPEGIRAAAHLLAWKLRAHGAPAGGQVTVRSEGGHANPHPAGEEVTFERIAGHRDGSRTSCPGDALAAQLPELRRLAAEHAAGARTRYPAKLQVARAQVLRSRRQLDLLAPISRRASGTVDVAFRAAGRTRRFEAPIDAEAGRVRVRRSIARAQARLGTGIVTLRYPGNARTRPQDVRLRAASGRAELQARRPTLEHGRVRAQGTVTPRARGVVRVVLDYVADGTHRVLRLEAPIRHGRWRLDEALAPETLAEIDRRSGSLHAVIQFTGYLPARIRGEMRSLQVLGAR